MKLSKIKREKLKLLERIEQGGQKRKQSRLHERIIDNNFGRPAFAEERVVHGAVPPYFDMPNFFSLNRMGLKLFARLMDEITDPETGHEEFITKIDVMGENSASALQKLTLVVRLLAYMVLFDVVEEYTDASKGGARKALYIFCN